MKLTIYADEAFLKVREVKEVPRMKIPYRVGQYVAQIIDKLDFNDPSLDEKALQLVLESKEHVTAVVRATFGLPEEDLDYIDLMELGELAQEIIACVMGKIGELGPGEDPNGQPQAQTMG